MFLLVLLCILTSIIPSKDRPDSKADALGVKYTAGFIAPVLGDTYLKQHDAPEDIALLVRSSYDVQDCA